MFLVKKKKVKGQHAQSHFFRLSLFYQFFSDMKPLKLVNFFHLHCECCCYFMDAALQEPLYVLKNEFHHQVPFYVYQF